MKSRNIYRLFMMMALVVAAACASDETKVVYLGGTSPTLTVSDTSTLVLTKANADYSSLQFSWTYPNYHFTNGVSTQDVFYTLEFDSVGANFANPGTVPFTNVLSNTFLVKELNNALGSLSYPDFVKHNFEFRIKATMASGSAVVYSNVVKVKITTYLDVVYPVPANLYLIGSATPAQWNNDVAHLVPAQQFTKVNSYLFQLNSVAIGGGAGSANQFLFIPVAGDWSHKYAFDAPGSTNNTSGDFFKPDANSNFQAPAAAGNYMVQVNFKTGKYSLTKL